MRYMGRTVMNIRLFLLASCCALFISACSQNDTPLDGHENYIGTWQNAQSELIIHPSGHVNYKHQEHTEKSIANQTFNDAKQTNFTAPITSFNAQSFRIGQDQLNHEFKIDQAPYQDEQGHWKMTLNGESYTRK